MQIGYTFFVSAQCRPKPIIKQCKSSIAPYKYDSYAVTEISYGEKSQKFNVEFSAFMGYNYKIVFCTQNLPESIGIKIWDKPKQNKKRKLVYFDDSNKDSYLCQFEPDQTGTYYIDYEVPAATKATGKDPKGCVVMLIGIKEQTLK